MEGLALGKAFFEFAIKSEGIAQGMASIGSTVAGGVGKVVPQVGKMGDSLSNVSNKLDGVVRSTERFSRGLRGVSPDIARAKERVYELEDSQARLGRTIERQKMLIEEKQQRERANLDTIQRLAKAEQTHMTEVGNLNAALENERGILETMNQSTIQNAKAIEQAESAYRSTTAQIEQLAVRGEKWRAQMALLDDAVDQRAANEEKLQIKLRQNQTAYESTVSGAQKLRATIDELQIKYDEYHTRIEVVRATQEREAAQAARLAEQAQQEAFALKDLVAQKLRTKTIDAEMRHDISNAASDQALYAVKVKLATEALAKLQQLQAANPGKVSNLQIEYATAKLDKLKESYIQARDRVRELTRDYGDYGIEIGRTAEQEAFMNAKLEETIKRQQEMEAFAARRESVMKEHIADYTTLGARIENEKDRLAQLNVEEQRQAAAIRETQHELSNLAATYRVEDAAIEEKRRSIQALEAQMQQLALRQEEEYQAMVKARSTLGPTTDEFKAQADRIAELERALRKETDAQELSTRKKREAEQRQKRLTAETQSAQLTLKDLMQSENKYATAIEFAKQRLSERVEKAKQKKQADKEAKDAADQVAKSEQRVAQEVQRASGAQAASIGPIQRATSIQQQFNMTMTKTSSLLRDIAVGAIGPFFGNTLSTITTNMMGFGQTGLDAYKNYELLSQSLTALSARELVATGKFKDLAAAQQQAALMGKESLAWISQLAIQSPFSDEDIKGAFRLGAALGFTTDQIKLLIKDTVDWASATGGSGEQVESVVRALGQMHNTGHVTLEDINQMTDAGLSARDVLRQEFAPEIKASKKSLEDLISDGVLPADRAINALSRSMEKDFGASPGLKMARDQLAEIGETGVVTSANITRLQEAGLNVNQVFQDAFGPIMQKTGKTMQELTTQGLIPAADVTRVLGDAITKNLAGGAEKAGSSMTGLLNSIGDLKNTALREFFTKTFEVVQPMVSNIVAMLQNPDTIASIRGFGEMLGNGVGQVMNWLGTVALPIAINAFQKFGPIVMDALSYLGAIAQQAYQWGYNIGNMFANGLADTIEMVMQVVGWIGDTLSGWLEPHSPPKILPNLDTWGTRTMQVYLDAFTQADSKAPLAVVQQRIQRGLTSIAGDTKRRGQESIAQYFAGWSETDFSTFSELKSTLSGMLSSLADAGQIDQAAVVPTMLGAGDALKSAIDQIRQTGAVSEETFRRIREAGGAAGAQIEAYARSMLRVQTATDAVKKAQDNLNAITSQYDKQIAALQAKLDKAQQANTAKDRQKEIDRLKYVLANNVRNVDADAVRNRITELETQNQIDSLERQKKTAVDTAQAKLDAAQKELDKAQQAFDFQKQLIAQQKENNDLVKQQIQLMEQMAKQQDKTAAAQDKAAKKAEAERKKQEREQKAINDAEYQARLAAATSEEEKLRIMQERQSQFAEGTVEYLRLQKDIEAQQKKVQSSVQSLGEAEFEASLKGKKRADQISMVKDHLANLTEGTKEYIKWTGRLNALEGAEANASLKKGKGGKGKGKGGDLLPGSPLRTLTDVQKGLDNVGQGVSRVTGAFATMGEKIDAAKKKIQPFFDFLNQHGGAIAFVFQKLLVSFLVAVAIEKVVKPLLSFVWGLRQFITWGNVAWVALTALGYAWKTNFGGIRDIVAEVWQAIQKPLADIKNIIDDVSKAFSEQGLKGAINKLLEKLPQLGGDIANIGVVVFDGVKKWVTPFITGLLDVVKGVADWVKGGGLMTLWNTIRSAIESLFSTAGSDGFFSSAAIASGILGLVGGLQMVIQSAFGDIVLYLNTEGPGLMKTIGDWLQQNIPVALEYVLNGLAVLIAGALEGLIPAMVTIGKRIIDITTWLVPMLPDLLSSLVSAIALLVTWLIGRGIPLLFKGVVDLLTYLYNKLGEMFPKLGFNLGRLIGSTITKLLGALIVGVGALLFQLWQSLQDGSFLEGAKKLGLAFLNAIIGVFKGLVGLILGIFAGLWEPIASIAKQIVNGLGEGITGEWHVFLEAVGKAFDDFVSWVKNFLGISSPSKLFMDIATNIVDGLRQGMEFLHQLWTDVLAWLGQFISDFIANALKWEDDVLAGIDSFVMRFLTFMTDLTLKVIDVMIKFFADLLGKFGVNKDQVLEVIGLVRDGLIGAWTYISTEATRIFNEVLTTIGTWIETVKGYFIGENGLVSVIQGAWNSITESITNWGTTIAETFTTAIESAKRALVDGLNDLIDTANDAIDALNAVSDKVGIGHINHIPKIAYALGTNYAEGGLALVGEEGPELVNLPRGAEVSTTNKTMAFFENAAKDMLTQVQSMVDKAMASVSTTVDRAVNQMAQAYQAQSAPTQPAQQVVTNITTTTNERHDHWNLTVNTKAETPAVVADFATMRAMAGV